MEGALIDGRRHVQMRRGPVACRPAMTKKLRGGRGKGAGRWGHTLSLLSVHCVFVCVRSWRTIYSLLLPWPPGLLPILSSLSHASSPSSSHPPLFT